MKIYLVVYNSGERLDHIERAYLSKEKAEKYCKRLNTPLMGNSYWTASIIEMDVSEVINA